jgi:hypothetical protein
VPQEYLHENKLHIAYEYAYSKTFTMSRSDHQEFSGDASAAVKGIVDLLPKVKVEVTRNATISFSAKDEVVPAFAYKAGQLLKEDGHWAFKPEIVQKGLATGPVATMPYLPAYGVVLRADELALAVSR